MSNAVALAYLVSAALFVVGLKRLSRVRTSRNGNVLSAVAMLVAVAATLIDLGLVNYTGILIGIVAGGAAGGWIALRAKATAMPQIVAWFNGFGGAASAVVALAVFWLEVVEADTTVPIGDVIGVEAAVGLVLGILVGAVTFSGSAIAERKLAGAISGMPRIPARTALMALLVAAAAAAGIVATVGIGDAGTAAWVLLAALVVSLLVGVVLVVPIGGADMPVVISLLNSLSGLAAAFTGFAIGNLLLIIAGTIVGAAGLILTQIMCRAMNRSLANVVAGGYGGGDGGDDSEYENVLSTDAEEAAMVLEAAQSVVIVPGYGLAAARAQHTAYELAKVLGDRGVDVKFAIHPVAGRMPGHMNVVLAEADVPYAQLYEMDEINHEFKNTDVAIVVGANDVVNPAANTQPGSPIAGMPILNVGDAGRVLVIKRSLSPGYAGIKNELFEADNTFLLFADAKEALHQLTTELSKTAAT